MAEDAQSIVDALTTDEVKVLTGALKRVEKELFHLVMARAAKVGAVVLTLFTLFGIASLSTIRSAAIDAAANRVAADANIRGDVVAAASVRLQSVNTVLEKAAALNAQLDRERTDAALTIRADLARIAKMIQQVEREVAEREAKDGN